ncbi:MAG TPA: nicotinate-nicotinamide nucleotide adenylyltransferase [Candidatus Woesebacteria bacterium]|nr:nicotinate-nicotinamide nucleotide adenylyltransferase [Candidatus Woesebacteria bacterium]
MEKLRIGIGGSAANPPQMGHRHMIESLLNSEKFDEIFWIPSGIRPDKEGFVAPDHRVAMTILTFPTDWLWQGKTKFNIKFSDVYGGNTPTVEVVEEFIKQYPEAEIIWFTGVDSVVPMEKYGGKCEIQTVWVRGEELYNNCRFLILPRPGYPDPKSLDLPDNFEILDVDQLNVSSTEVREKIGKGESITGLVTEEVEEYIRRNHLYK